MKESSGLSKNKIKYLHALRQKKQRQKYNKFIVEGDKIARELLDQQGFVPEFILATSNWIQTNKSLLKVYLNKIITVSESELKQVSQLSTPNSVLIVADIYSPPSDSSNTSIGLSLYLDGIRDPGNMGTILRIADWFGIQYIFCSPDCVDVYGAKVVQASMGAFLRVRLFRTPLPTIVAQYPDVPLYGTVLDGGNVFQMELPETAMLVIGNESKGLSEESRALLQHKIAIPAPIGGGAESLNAAVATGIFCAVFRNQ